MANPAGEGGVKLPGARQGEADHVDDDVGGGRGDRGAEGVVGLQRVTVQREGFDRLPGVGGQVGRGLAAGHGRHLVAGGDKPRHEVAADVAGGADDRDACHGYSAAVCAAWSQVQTRRGVSGMST